jgi:hypothetical protein
MMVMMNNMEKKIQDKLELLNLQLQHQREVTNQQCATLNNNIRQYGGTIHSDFAQKARQQQATNQQAPLEPVNLFGSYGAQDRRAAVHPRPRCRGSRGMFLDFLDTPSQAKFPEGSLNRITKQKKE